MDFPAQEFDALGEADVREEILAPLLRDLGYRAGTAHNVMREQMLRYPRVQLGRKNDRRDPPLRGKADYILEAGGSVRWTIEAKSPERPISLDDVEQAYTYANHPEIRAVFFCVTNGKQFTVFQTNRGPEASPIFAADYAGLADRETELRNLLAPDRILQNHPRVEVDKGRPLGPRLRSFARVTGGSAEIHSASPNLPMLGDIIFHFGEGSVERLESGGLAVWMRVISPFRSANQLDKMLRSDELELFTSDEELSASTSFPTKLSGKQSLTIPRGTRLPALGGGTDSLVQRDLSIEVTVDVSGSLTGHSFSGSFQYVARFLDAAFRSQLLTVNLRGAFRVHLV